MKFNVHQVADHLVQFLTWHEGYNTILDAILDKNARVFVAGGAVCMDTPNDIDVFASAKLIVPQAGRVPWDKVIRTPTATTILLDDATVQMCNYPQPTLRDLVETFDFAHVQAGITLTRLKGNFVVEDAFATADCIEARDTGQTWYTGSAFPFSSLVRSLKYAERGWIRGRPSQVATTVAIMSDICTRGVTCYTDFKNQLDAVDLGMIDGDTHELTNIYRTLLK